jgi:hypothetical protein
MTDPVLLGKVLATYQEKDSRPEPPPLGPPRREMLEALTAA